MTRPAAAITFTFAGEDGVWAAESPIAFLPGAHLATREELVDWFLDRAQPEGWFARVLGTKRYPFAISTALTAPALRYHVAEGAIFMAYAAFSGVDAEYFEKGEPLPLGARLERVEHTVQLVFEQDRPLHLSRDVELVRCDHGQDVHWYEPQFGGGERRVLAVDGRLSAH